MAVQNSMTIHTFLDIVPQLPDNLSVLLRAKHGVGKSQVVHKLARMLKAQKKFDEYEVIDRRLAQLTEGDMVGLPSTDGCVTRFNPPDWYKRACDKPCVLFLDELNRATHEVMQAAFQVVLDRELNGWKLHPETRVYAAINNSAEYTINEMDPALLDRFWTVDLQPDLQDWTIWAREEGKINDVIIDFLTLNEKWLDPAKNAEGGSVQPSRRSWEKLNNALTEADCIDDPEDPRFYPMCMGFIGIEAACAFHDFAKSVDFRVSGEEVINSYSKVEKKIQRMTQDRLNGLIEKVAEYVTKNIPKALNAKQGKNLNKFMKLLPGELRVNCWSKLTAQGLDKLDLARSVHKYCAVTILDVFGVPAGEAGVGMVPNIPGMFQNKNG